MKPRKLLTICVLTVVGFSSGSRVTLADTQSSKAQIAFIEPYSAQADSLNVIDFDGTDRRTLVQEMAGNFAWSSDGSQIAYTARDGIYTINADGSNPRKIAGYKPVDTDLDPRTIDSMAWLTSPERIVLHSRAKPLSNSFLFVTPDNNPNTSELSVLISCRGIDDEPINVDPNWSDVTPDGISPPLAWPPQGSVVLVMSHHRIYACDLRHGDYTPRFTANEHGDDGDPAWSPDIEFIVFDSTRDNLFTSSPSDYRHDIFIMNADGTNQRDLTFAFGIHDEFARANSMEPSVSPDSRCIAFSSTGQAMRHSIYTMTIDGKEISRLTNPNQDPPGVAPERHWDDYRPQWSPDGRYISYHAVRDSRSDLNVIELSTGDIYRGLFYIDYDVRYAWRPLSRQ